MNSTFDLIGIDVPSQKAFNFLAEQADTNGEPTRLTRDGAVLHGRCWKLGEGLEVWTVLYERGTSESGEVFYADCRPGFRARHAQRISPWALTEYTEEGEAMVHGYCDESATEVLFELQNLTEVGATSFHASDLQVSLCGLAYRARICGEDETPGWQPLLNETSFVAEKPFMNHKNRNRKAGKNRQTIDALPPVIHENDWSLRGRVIACKELLNPLSGSELVWARVDLDCLKLEVLINNDSLRTRGGNSGKNAVQVGAMVAVDVWLQGHVLDARTLRARYEGIDYSAARPAQLWRNLRRRN